MKIIKLVLLLSLCFFLLPSCSDTAEKPDKSQAEPIAMSSGYEAEPEAASDSAENDGMYQTVTFEVENYGNFVVEIYPQYAPDTVSHFLSLVSSGYYDGFAFERIIHSEALVTSDEPLEPKSDSGAVICDTVNGEFTDNGRSNDLELDRYTLVLDHVTGQNDSGKAKFRILLSDGDQYEGHYAGFAKVIEGTEIIDRICGSECDNQGTFYSPIVMKKVYINE